MTRRIGLRILGTVDLRMDGRSLNALLAQPKRTAVLFYLALATPRGFVRRDTLLALFWPELDEEHARRSLRQALYVLRGTLGPDVILKRGDDEVGLNWTICSCDAASFLDAVNDGGGDRALSMYSGELLPGFHLSNTPEFEHWLSQRREELRLEAVGVASDMSERAEQAGDLAAAERNARRAVDLAPYEEKKLRRLVSLLDRVGDRAAAIREYESFVKRLAEELEAEPAPETVALISAVRRRVKANSDAHLDDQATAPSIVDTAGAAQSPASTTPISGKATLLRRKLLWLGAMAAGAILVAVGGKSWVTPTLPNRFLIAVFANETGDSTLNQLGRMVADWTTRSLASASTIDIVASGPVLRFLPARIQSYASEQLPADIVNLANQKGATVVVWGAYTQVADSLEFSASTYDSRTALELRTIPTVRVAATRGLDAIEPLRMQIAAALAEYGNERLVTLVNTEPGPPTYDAYDAFLDGIDELYLHFGTYSQAYEHFLRAASLDSSFTKALVHAATTLARSWRLEEADSLAGLILETHYPIRPVHRVLLEYVEATTDVDYMGQYAALRRLNEEQYGDDYWQYEFVRAAQAVGRYDESLDVLAGFDTERYQYGNYWRLTTIALHHLGRHEEELEKARMATEQYPESPNTVAYELRALAASGRIDDLVQRFDEIAMFDDRRHFVANVIRDAATYVLVHHSKQEALPLFERAVSLFEEADPEMLAYPSINEGRMRACYHAGRWEELDALAQQDEPPDPEKWQDQAWIGLSAARQGNASETRRVIEFLEQLPDSQQRYGYDTYYRGQLHALLGDQAVAVTLLEQALREGVKHEDLRAWPLAIDSLRDYRPFIELMKPKG